MFDPNKPPLTLGELAHRAFVDHAASPCLGAKPKSPGQDKVETEYSYVSYAAVAQRVRHVAGGLMEMGLERGERAAILSENRPEWAISDLACQMLGVISVPMFATLPPVQVKTILEDCGASLIFVSTPAQAKKIEAIVGDLPDMRAVVVFDEHSPAVPSTVSAVSLAQLETRGEEHLKAHPTAYESTWPAASQDDVATIIYTSGTTGEPKGVMLSHRNLISNAEAVKHAIIEAFGPPRDEVFLSFLPLAHIYERTAGFILPLRMGAAIAYCESLFTVDKNLREARPTLMMCVPRLYESMRDKLHAAGSSLPENKRSKYADALALAQKAGAHRGGLPDAPALGLLENLKLRAYDAAVYSKIRDKFGGRMRAFISGGAPMSSDLGALFMGLGFNILEGYGLTETSPVIAVNRPGRVRLGTVGEGVSSCEIKIAEDGEILVRGASITKGYWNKPEQTLEAIQDGWFHTGDIGELENGYLKITDRKKDLLVLGNGKKVAPAPIEMKLCESPYIAQVVLLGDSSKAVRALIVPDMKALHEYSSERKLELDDAAMLAAPEIDKLIRKEIDARTSDLADFERVRRFVLLAQPFSVEAGEMTPTLKIKRRVVAEKYGAQLGAD